MISQWYSNAPYEPQKSDIFPTIRFRIRSNVSDAVFYLIVSQWYPNEPFLIPPKFFVVPIDFIINSLNYNVIPQWCNIFFSINYGDTCTQTNPYSKQMFHINKNKLNYSILIIQMTIPYEPLVHQRYLYNPNHISISPYCAPINLNDPTLYLLDTTRDPIDALGDSIVCIWYPTAHHY